MQLPSLNTPKIVNAETKKKKRGWRKGRGGTLHNTPRSLNTWDPSSTAYILIGRVSPRQFRLKLGRSCLFLRRRNIFTYKALSVHDFCGSRSKNLVAFMCLPKELILQEVTSWLPTLLSILSPFLAVIHPTMGLPPGQERKLQIQKALWEATGAGQDLQSSPESPGLGPCPVKEQNLSLLNDC